MDLTFLNKKNIYLIIQNIFSLFLVKGLDLVLTLFLIPFLIIKVGIYNYGIYAFSMSLMLFFLNVLNYGFDLSAVREIALHRDNSTIISKIVSKVISVKLFLFLVIYIFFTLLMFIVPMFWNYKSLYFFASLVLLGDLFSLRWFFLGLEKMKFISIMSTISTLIYVLVVVNIVKVESDYIYIPIAEAIGLFLVSSGTLLWVIKAYQVRFRLLSISEILNYLKNNFNSFINLMLPSTYGVICVFLVGIIGVPYDVTITQIGFKFTSAFSTVNTILSTVFYSMINRDKKSMVFVRLFLIGIGFFISILMLLSSDFLILNWLKLESHLDFINTTKIIVVLSPIPFLMGIISSYGVNGLLVFFEDTLYCIITISSSLVMLFLCFWLIPKYHFLGGGLAFLIGRFFFASLLMFFFLTRKKRFENL